ncbi:MAG: ATP12 family protein [Rhodospirillaceae bacterium]|nr:ATP12 family protein [Rhodospirillaceae bacterium]
MAQADLSKLSVREPPPPKPKRVYKSAAVGEAGPPWAVLLDGRPARTPLRRTLESPVRAVAAAVAAEWDAQREVVAHETMPLTRLLATALDKVIPDRAGIIGELLKYVDADMLCYRADHPTDLAQRQAAVWQPVLDWVEGKFGVALVVSSGVMPARQAPAVVQGLRRALDGLDDFQLTAAQAGAAATGSIALGLALALRRLSGAEAFAAAQLDESYQIERWGEDALAHQRRQAIAAELEAIARFAALATQP